MTCEETYHDAFQRVTAIYERTAHGLDLSRQSSFLLTHVKRQPTQVKPLKTGLAFTYNFFLF